jgi:hypothetical protein
VSETFELSDEASCLFVGVEAGEVLAAGVAVELAAGEHVPAGDDDRVSDGADRFLVPAASLQASVLRGEVGVARAGVRLAASVSAIESQREPLRGRPKRRLPADSSLPGQRPAQEAR